ncbi:proline racemase family protein [Temperatibacter marinus]|uniref:Proline racemase family protein n=1 Tax=Temperatibacter marinus TaxID=1456591 RepID=A0AA52EKE8_9PROT|nr:proline racemase family protein [Temperatibacter marinus]WND03854.1 proline racemase family protein [Temperatibacter marinus]
MRVIDSHTGGQPTRVLIDVSLPLGSGSVAEQLSVLRSQRDDIRRETVLDPKCSDAMVGALVVPPQDSRCSAGVIFFNSAGYLGMCGHGLIGLMVTLYYLGRIDQGDHFIETPVGIVKTTLTGPNQVSFVNVESFCFQKDVRVTGSSLACEEKPIVGDVAWGGNWFFLVETSPLSLCTANISSLTDYGFAIRRALKELGITGLHGEEIDHIEFFEKPETGHANSKNFVLCPGGAYDRSPCGTGTSAKLACLAERHALAPGDEWVQESIVGSQFKATYEPAQAKGIIPTIAGEAYIFADATLIQQSGDPFQKGIKW